MRKLWSKLAAAAALASMSATANAQAKKCLSVAEASAVISYALPDIIVGVRDKCRTTLAADSFLATQGDALVSRYRVYAEPLWPTAKVAMVKIIDDDKVMRFMPDAAFKPFLNAIFSGVVSQDIKPASCPTIDDAFAALAPLPPENMARLITILLESEGGKPNAKAPFDMCPAQGRQGA